MNERSSHSMRVEVMGHQELFVCPRPKWKRSDKILFTTSPIGCNQLQLIVDNLTFDFSFLKEIFLLNKTRRGFEINTSGEGSHSMRVQHGGYGSSRPNLIYGKTTLSFFYFYSLLLVLDLSFCSSFVTCSFVFGFLVHVLSHVVFNCCFICKHNQIDTHMRDKTLQYIIINVQCHW